MPGLFQQFSTWIKRIRLINQLSTKDNNLRQKTLFEIGALKDPGALPILLPLLHDPDAAIRYRAAEALGTINDNRAIPVLREAYAAESDNFTRMGISFALLSLGQTDTFDDLLLSILENCEIIDDVEQNDYWDVSEMFETAFYERLKGDAMPLIKRGLRHPDWHIRWIMIEVLEFFVLEDISAREAAALIKKARKDEKPEIQNLAEETIEGLDAG